INELLDLERDEYPLKDNIAEQIKLKTKPQEDLIRSVKAALNIDENRISEIVNEAAENFNRSFDRWRELYRFADTQRNEAADELKQNIDRDAQQKADKRLREARRQIDLLFQQNVAREEGDFYPYRYLATEGFLPGYNFPKLPLRAWVSRGDGEFISRARSIALKEFAPENIIYHEGSRWKVDSFRATLDQLENLRYKRIICNECGAFNNEENDVCESCRTRFEGGNYNLVSLLTMTNVSTVRRDRITSNEEERRRLGYKIDISYQFSPTADGQNKIEADVVVDGEPLLRMIYAPAATLLGINSGFREDNNRGFLVNFANGRIERVNGATRVFLAVQDTQNILLIKFLNEDIQNDKEFTPSMQYALQRGIEQAFGIDESEISSMMLGKGANLSLLYYEASEGGCGVLESLMYEVNAIGLVAKEALLRCHFNEKGEDLYPHCEVACYECLLSFTNQTNAMLINRRKISEFLLSLTNGKAQVRTGGRSYKEQIAWLRERVDKNSELEIKFLKALESLGAHLPDRAQQKIANPNCVADFYYERNKVCIFCDGTVHDSPGQKERDKTIRDELMKKGYRVVVIRYDAKCEELIRERKDIFGV
ncbi:MAG TPA: Zn-binding domain-containing protein, partial [Pyrinomonadaceae bacterium]|nr:Zn-binding domain-containing protein [Pyrinomonadaceae bacterium]